MRKSFLRAILAGMFLVAICVAGVLVASPVIRTKSYIALVRAWAAHWPIDRGKWLPTRLAPALQPFAPMWVEVEPQLKMMLDPNDLISRTILQTGAWEPEIWKEIERQLQSGATFVDVGAHIGYYSLKAARAVGPTGHVIAVEPNPETVRMLRDNVRANDVRTITVLPVACSDSETTLQFFAAPKSNTGQSSLSRANASQEGSAVTSYTVPSRRLDAIIRETGISRVDLLKIDVEGAELVVLKGAKEILTRYRPILFLELLDHQLRAMGTSSAEIIGFLHSRGYAQNHSFINTFEFAPVAAPKNTPNDTPGR